MQTSVGMVTTSQPQTAGAPSVFNATLKGKINGLEETVNVLSAELEFYSGEIQQLKDEKSQLESSLATRTLEIRTSLSAEVVTSDENLKANYVALKQDNLKQQNGITQLKTEKTNLNQHLLDLRRRVAELELMIGDENN